VNLGSEVKVAGLGQRMIPGAAHVGVVLAIGGADELRRTLVPVYRELGLGWRPETAGAVADRVPGISVEGFESALLQRLRRNSDHIDSELDPETKAAALAAAPGFMSPGGGRSAHEPGRGG
jgi:hypothetical protein